MHRESILRSLSGSDVWVEFGDLPEATRSALWEKHERQIASDDVGDLPF